MESSGIRRRWRRRAIVLLVALNTALWASLAWSAVTSGRSRGRPHAAAASRASHSPTAPGQ